MIDREKLGLTIRDLRRAAGLTQQQLADKLGVTHVTIHQIERAKSMPSVTALHELAAALGVGYGVLFGDPLALADLAVARIRAEVRALGYDLALIRRPSGDGDA